MTFVDVEMVVFDVMFPQEITNAVIRFWFVSLPREEVLGCCKIWSARQTTFRVPWSIHLFWNGIYWSKNGCVDHPTEAFKPHFIKRNTYVGTYFHIFRKWMLFLINRVTQLGLSLNVDDPCLWRNISSSLLKASSSIYCEWEHPRFKRDCADLNLCCSIMR